MSIYQLKTRFQNFLRPVSDMLVKRGVTANQVTIAAVILSGTTAYLIANKASNHRKVWYCLPLSLFIRMSMNAIDGMMAREHGQASKLGAFLNEAGDLVSDAMLIGSLKPHVMETEEKTLCTVGCLALSTELVSIIGERFINQRANHGPLGKSDRAFELGCIGLLVGSGLLLKPHAKKLMIVNQVLLAKTLFNRIKFVTQTYRQQQSDKSTLANIQLESGE